MTPVQWRVGKDGRTSWFVPIDQFDATYASFAPYSNDGRPLRYLGEDVQPSGTFAAFEGASGNERGIKRIEQNPSLVLEMFAEVWAAEYPGGSAGEVVYGTPAGALTDYGKILRSYLAAVEKKDLGTVNRSIQQLLEKNAKPTIHNLPPEEIKIAAEKIKEAETSQEKTTEPENKNLWLIGVAILGGLILLASGKGNQDAG